MAFAGNVCRHFHAVGEPDAGDFADSGVWLAGSFRRDLGADTPLERRRVERRAVLEGIEATGKSRGAVFAYATFALSFSSELVDGRHLENPQARDRHTIYK